MILSVVHSHAYSVVGMGAKYCNEFVSVCLYVSEHSTCAYFANFSLGIISIRQYRDIDR